MKLLEEINYRQWQKRNSELFHDLSLEQQRQARKKGYYNSGWGKVKSSWELLQDFKNNTYKVVSLFEHELNKGNLVKAIDLAIIESEKAKKMSEEGKQELEKISKNLPEIAAKALAKYLGILNKPEQSSKVINNNFTKPNLDLIPQVILSKYP